MDPTITTGASAILLTVVGWFLRETMSDLDSAQSDISDLKTEVALVKQRSELLDEMRADIHTLRADISWIRERLAGMASAPVQPGPQP